MTDRLKYHYQVDLADSNSAATKVIRFVDGRKRVLEIGAGPGSILRVLKQRFGCNVTAIEINDAAVAELRTFCDRVYQLDLNAPSWPDALAAEAPFDVVIAADVLEHLVDPLAALRALMRLLAADGHVVISLPNAAHSGVIASLLHDDFHYGAWGLLDQTHIRFFGPRNVDDLLAEANLEVAAKQYVTRQPSQTEFAESWSNLAAEQRAILARRSSGSIYQIVVKARPRDRIRRPDNAGAAALAIGAEAASARGAPPAAPANHGEPPPGAPLAALMLAASHRQEAGNLEQARRLFLRAINENGENFDALHMLGVIELQEHSAETALPYFRRALSLLKAEFPPFFRNLGLCMAGVQRERGSLRTTVRADLPRADACIHAHIGLPGRPADSPLVSVVLARSTAEMDAAHAIESINAQSYEKVELIVVDCVAGSESARDRLKVLATKRFPARWVEGAQGATGTLFALGVAHARGRYVALLEAQDAFSDRRIEHAVRAMASSEARWGFTNMAFVDMESRPITYGEQPDVDAAMRAHASLYARATISEALMLEGALIGGGNLFFERNLFRDIGHVGNVRHQYGWLMALMAAIVAEPAYVDEPDYVRRVVPDAADAAQARAAEESFIRDRWLDYLERLREVPNKRLEQAKRLRRQYDFNVMSNGGGHLLDRTLLLRYFDDIVSGMTPVEDTR